MEAVTRFRPPECKRKREKGGVEIFAFRKNIPWSGNGAFNVFHHQPFVQSRKLVTARCGNPGFVYFNFSLGREVAAKLSPPGRICKVKVLFGFRNPKALRKV
jgi:hypothetical protein